MSDNIILVTVDSLRADKCGFLNDNSDLTPNLDSLASKGISFENAIAPGPRTPDTLPALFTGRYPVTESETKIESEQSIIKNHLQRYNTIAEKLSNKGYQTAAFTPNPYTSRYFGYDRGFDHFRDFIDEDSSSVLFERILDGGSTPAVAFRLIMSAFQRENVFRSWESYFDDIEAWIENATQPYFLWVFLMDCHVPYLSSKSNRTQGLLDMLYGNVRWYWNDKTQRFASRDHDRLIEAYDDSIRHVDEFIGEVNDIAPDARLVITADHGESFHEHNRYGHPPNWLYEENIHVPMVISGVESSETVRSPVSITDIGEFLRSKGVPDSPPNSAITYSQSLSGDRIAARGETWKYIASIEDGRVAEGELYDLRNDSEERKDLSEDDEELVSLCRAAIQRRLNHHKERAVVRKASETVQ